MDPVKWFDNLLCLNSNSRQLLIALQNVKQMCNATQAQNSSDYRVFYHDTQLTVENEYITSPHVPFINVLVDINLQSLRKSILKQFPQVGDISKVSFW
jgi:hypothetical protein